MNSIAKIREKYPQYHDLSDEELASGLHRKYYSDMPMEEFHKKINFAPQVQQEEPAQQEKSISDIPRDVGMGVLNAALDLPGYAANILSDARDVPHQVLHNPLRALGNLGAGLGEAAIGTYNLPYSLAQSLKSHNVPWFKQTADYVPHIPDLGIERRLGLDKNEPGDEALRALSLLAPGAAAKKFLPYASHRLPSVTPRQIANDILINKKIAASTASNEYKDFFKKASEAGISHSPIPRIKQHQILTNAPSGYVKDLQEYINNPTLEHAHKAQSEMGGLVRHYEKLENTIDITPAQRKTLVAAKEARDDIKKSMFDKKRLGGNEDLAKEYKEVSNRYRENVVPYKRLKSLTKFERNEITPRSLIDKLRKDPQFMDKLAKEHKGISLYGPTAKTLAKGAIGAYIGSSALEKALKGL